MEVLRNGVFRFESKPQPVKPEPVGDPRRSQYNGGGIKLGPDVDYAGQTKTVEEWIPLVANRITSWSRKGLTGGPFTESEFFDWLETQDVEMYC